MNDAILLEHLVISAGSNQSVAKILGVRPENISNWKQRGISARWRPTIWALLETRCPDVAAALDRNTFLGVHLTGDAA